MKQFDFSIVGAGIIGLSTALILKKKYPDKSIVLLDKESSVAHHQTGRNSGVLHSGIYYPPGSKKAINCLSGYQLMTDYCRAKGIPIDVCGKLIVAFDDSEIPRLMDIYERGRKNGLENLRLLEPSAAKEFEPFLKSKKALLVPSTAILDFSRIAESFKVDFLESGGELELDFKVKKITHSAKDWKIFSQNNEISSLFLINCAGLYSDQIASMCGINPSARIIPFRGEYFRFSDEASAKVKGLIYPVPDPRFPFLGVHLSRKIDGAVEAGPNAVLAFKREGYSKGDLKWSELWNTISYPGFWRMAAKYWKAGLAEEWRSRSKTSFLRDIRRMIPEIEKRDLTGSRSGVRAQALTRDGRLVDDFLIDRTENSIHVLNAPSPAATASLAIANEIVREIGPL